MECWAEGMKKYKKPRLHAGHMEIAVARLFGIRRHTIVPNVSWGLNLSHEADLLILDKSGRFTEVEIKISLSDLKADFNKPHGHESKFITRLVYACPEDLCEYAGQNIPKHAGLIRVVWNPYGGIFMAEWVKKVRHSTYKVKPDDSTVLKFMSLGCMRIWTLKQALINSKQRLQYE